MSRRVVTLAYSVLLRAIIAIGGAITAYGATGMFTTGGIMPPNGLVLTGGLVVAIVGLAMWSKERRLDGLWAVLMFAVPYMLYSLGSWSTAECPPNAPPQTPAFSCAPVGTHAIGVVAPIVSVSSVVLFVRDVRALARR